MSDINSKLTVIFSTTATENRAYVGIYYENISVYDLSTWFINDINESYKTLMFANKKQMKNRIYDISVEFRRHNCRSLIEYSSPMRFALTRRGLCIDATFVNRSCKTILQQIHVREFK